LGRADISADFIRTSREPTALGHHAASCLALIRAERPKVHALTNFVAMNFSANLLLAAGAVPSMTFRADAVADFVAGSRSLVVNLGMLDAEREAAIKKAVPLARELGRPWLLDPVKVERSGERRRLALDLLAQRPAVLRANAGEVVALAGEGEWPAAGLLARRFGCVVAETGAEDLITDGENVLRIANGSPLMDRVTAMGCAASALMGAFLAVEPDAFRAAAATLLVLGVAGEIAHERAAGPGTFQPALLDAVYALDATALVERARVR
jgi:hydroxyethylthiazole kinase